MLFTDANYWIALLCEKDENHRRSIELEGELSKEHLLLNEHAFGEVFTFIARRYDKVAAYNACRFVLATPNVELLQASNEEINETLEVGKMRGFSFADCLTLVQLKNNQIKRVVSFDSDFDKISWVERIF